MSSCTTATRMLCPFFICLFILSASLGNLAKHTKLNKQRLKRTKISKITHGKSNERDSRVHAGCLPDSLKIAKEIKTKRFFNPIPPGPFWGCLGRDGEGGGGGG